MKKESLINLLRVSTLLFIAILFENRTALCQRDDGIGSVKANGVWLALNDEKVFGHLSEYIGQDISTLKFLNDTDQGSLFRKRLFYYLEKKEQGAYKIIGLICSTRGQLCDTVLTAFLDAKETLVSPFAGQMNYYSKSKILRVDDLE